LTLTASGRPWKRRLNRQLGEAEKNKRKCMFCVVTLTILIALIRKRVMEIENKLIFEVML